MDIKITLPDEKKNDLTFKRMDLLEKKLDQQYRNFIEKKDTSINRNFDALTKSLSRSLGGFEKALKSFRPSPDNINIEKMLDSFERKLDQQYKSLIEKKKNAKSNNDGVLLNSLLKSIGELEKTIQGLKFPKRQMRVNGDFEKMTSRLEEAIRKTRPRLTPSPS